MDDNAYIVLRSNPFNLLKRTGGRLIPIPYQDERTAPLWRRFIDTYFSVKLDLRVRLFHILAMGGTFISSLMSILAIINGGGLINIAVNFAVAALSFSLLMFSLKTGRYQICYIVTIIGIFILTFPVIFISSGGYHSGMAAFCIFAVVFTIFMLEGKKAIFFATFEVLLYVAVCILCYLRPELVAEYALESEILTDVIISIVSVSAVLGTCLYLHFRLYNAQQKKLDEQNIMLMQLNRMKTEFLTNASHEMRTPLTVTSVNVQTVMEILEDMGETLADPEAEKLLKNAQSEIMRLSRMVGSMLTLASMSENTDRQKLDFSALLQNGIEVLSLNLSKRGNSVEVDIEPNLSVFGNADLLSQVLTNLLQNAGFHTADGVITVRASRQSNEIIVTVQDTGIGVSPELLPYVFERGVSTGGTGFGLYLCKTVVESHGGRIWIESKLGDGAAVFYTLPFYEGQLGEEEI